MSLAARCPACHTAFRVVQDQLRVSDGWVRCGRCGEVFNANETLFDLRAPTAAPSATPAPPSPDVEPSLERADEPGPEPAAIAPDSPLPEPPAPETGAAQALQAADAANATGSAPPGEPAVDMALPAAGSLLDHGERIEPTFGLPPAAIDAAPATAPVTPDAGAATASLVAPGVPTPAEATAAGQPGTANAELVTEARSEDGPEAPADGETQPRGEAGLPTGTPSFLREAERAARWESVEMRALLGGAAVLLAGAALIQAARGLHEPVSAQWPGARTWLDPLCRLAGCQRQPRRHLDGMSVEGSSLAKVNGSDLMRLSLVLRNRDRSELLLPAIELSLTDVQGATVARKVLTTAELGASDHTIAAGGEISLQAVLDTGGLAVTGYAVELFYP